LGKGKVIYEKWGTDQTAEGMVSHSNNGSVIRQLVGKLMDNDNDNMIMSKYLLVAYKPAAHTKQITAQKLCKITISNSQEAEGSEADRCPYRPL
jgi:hypothetical protein